MENKEVTDYSFEHSQHNPPYRRLMKVCSECYKKHEEIINKSKFRATSEMSRQGREAMDNHLLEVI